MSELAVYVSMPIVASIIGYLTTLAAIKMMCDSARIIRISAQLLTTRLLDPKEIFARLDADRIAKEIEAPLLLGIDEITREVMQRYHPALWEMLPLLAQDLIVKQVQAGSPAMVHRIMAELQENIDEMLDIKQVAVSALERDKELLVKLIREITRPEMAFMARRGIYCGFALGVVQTAVWALTHEPLIPPVFGAAIGVFTGWLAIKLFRGIFQRRRDEVAKQYGELVAREVMTVPNIVAGILNGPRSDRVLAMIQRSVQRTVDEQASIAKPFVSVAIGPKRFQEMKHAAADRALAYLSDTALHATDYATDAMDVADTITTRMRRLSRIDYEQLLRPAFRQDEWKLIAVGAVIGAFVGELQALLLLG